QRRPQRERDRDGRRRRLTLGASDRRLHRPGRRGDRARCHGAGAVVRPVSTELHERARSRIRATGGLLAALGVVAVAVLLGAMIGSAGPPGWRVPLAFLDRVPGVDIDSGVSDAEWSLIWNTRMPRVLFAGIVGAMLSVGGAAYQGVC